MPYRLSSCGEDHPWLIVEMNTGYEAILIQMKHNTNHAPKMLFLEYIHNSRLAIFTQYSTELLDKECRIQNLEIPLLNAM